jgi:hypothetical protein
MGLLQRAFGALKSGFTLPNEPADRSSEKGKRPTPENSLKYLYRTLWVDPDLRQAILDIREMDRLDGRVKRIHNRLARDTVKGGLVLQQAEDNPRIAQLWDDFSRRLQIDRAEKLKSDARGLVMEGNLPLQVVLDDARNVVNLIRMPSETILPNVDDAGRFKDITRAYLQFDLATGTELAAFPLWQLFLCRFDPDSFDDMGALGRPFLDANRSVWRKLRMTEEDLVIRRRTRAPLRLAHSLEGATKDELDAYQKTIENRQNEITTDFFLNKKGGVTAVQGDSNLDQIEDVVYLLDTFFSGSPLPKGLMGYTKDMARDILEDLKRDYYEEVDSVQDTQAYAYAHAFRLQLLLKGINPDSEDFTVGFAERRTETPNQTVDRGLKLKAMGLPEGMVWEELGYDATYVRQRRDYEQKHYDPYPDPNAIKSPGTPAVKVTPGNAPKGESMTSMGNRTALSEFILLYDADQPRVPAGNSTGGQWVGDNQEKESDKPRIRLTEKTGFYGMNINVRPHGLVDVEWPGFGFSDAQIREKTSLAVMEHFREKLPENTFWRFTNSDNEIDLIQQGVLRPSRNHADNFFEKGLSVAEGAHYSIQGYKYGYLIQGNVIGYGSDGEPILDLKTLKPASKLKKSADIAVEDRKRTTERLKKEGWTDEQFRMTVGKHADILK